MSNKERGEGSEEKNREDSSMSVAETNQGKRGNEDEREVSVAGSKVAEKSTSKRSKTSVSSEESGGRGERATFANSPAFGPFQASAYLQGLQAAFPNSYPNLFADNPSQNPFMPQGPTSFSLPNISTDLLKFLEKSQRSGAESLSAGSKVGQSESTALRQLIQGYRESAALLTRTADELELLLASKK